MVVRAYSGLCTLRLLIAGLGGLFGVLGIEPRIAMGEASTKLTILSLQPPNKADH